jgi:hypothetical protein
MRRGHWCGTAWGSWVALSALTLLGCGGQSYELGHEAGGTAGMGTGGDSIATASGAKTGAAGANSTGGSGTGGSAASPAAGDTGANDVGGAPDQTTGGTGAGGSTGGTVVVGDTTMSRIRPSASKLDLLLMIDNSIGMAQKQSLLAQSIPSLLESLSQFPSLLSLHVGIITSSLGDHGSDDVCSDAQNAANGGSSTYDDYAQLIPSVRTLTDADDQGFLTWDPSTSDTSVADAVNEQVQAAGEHGCGYEAQLESWYRFLVDPEPVGSMSNDQQYSTRGQANQVVLAERAAFLRPDSAVAIVMLSDENDCSILDENGTQGFLVGWKGGVGKLNWHMPPGTSACATDPNDPCCVPCGSVPPNGCPSSEDDSTCAQGNMLNVLDDSMNLRCYRQKQRFGIDLLYPVSRYTQGLTSQLIEPRMDGNSVQNPLYTPGADGTPARDPSMVYLAGIVGVPWQDLATPDALAGGTLAYMSAADLAANGRWD